MESQKCWFYRIGTAVLWKVEPSECSLLLAGPRDVLLLNMTIFTTDEIFGGDPEIYFACTDNDTRVYLPDVVEKNQLYTFNGHESFQPLTTLPTDQCKRCGIYNDKWIHDNTFAEWELCPLEFAANGIYEKYVHKKFDAIFYCQECSGLLPPPESPPQMVVLAPTAVPSALGAAPTTGKLLHHAFETWGFRQKEVCPGRVAAGFILAHVILVA
jgi:hypothetical protein